MRLLMTRPEPDASLSAERLRALGHEVLIDPVLHTHFSSEPIPWQAGMDFVVTSRNGMRALSMFADGLADSKMYSMSHVYTVGDATGALARESGFQKVVSADGAVDDLVSLLVEKKVDTVVYVCGRDRKGNLEQKLRSNNVRVDVAERYKADISDRFSDDTREAFENNSLDGVLLYSARTAEAFVKLMEQENISYSTDKMMHFCLAKAVASVFDRRKGIQLIVADRPNEQSLFAALERVSIG